MIYKILALLSPFSIVDPDGWVFVERPAKTPYYEEGDKEEAGDLTEPEWTSFAKTNGMEKTIVSFPAIPTYFYEKDGIVVQAVFEQSLFQFEVKNQTFRSAQELLDWRLNTLKSLPIHDQKILDEKLSGFGIEICYFDGEKWILERWIGSEHNTYFQKIESPVLEGNFHRQFLSSFDLDFLRDVSE